MVILDVAVGVDVTDSPVMAMGLRELDPRVELDPRAELNPRVELEELVTRVTGALATLAKKYYNDDNQDIRTWVISSGKVLSLYGSDLEKYSSKCC